MHTCIPRQSQHYTANELIKSIHIYTRKKTNLFNWSLYSGTCTTLMGWAEKEWMKDWRSRAHRRMFREAVPKSWEEEGWSEPEMFE